MSSNLNCWQFQERYNKEQEEMRQKFMADLKRSEEVEAQKKEQVCSFLAIHQMSLLTLNVVDKLR